MSPTHRTHVPLPSSLRGQHVLILGGSRGIGAAAGRLLLSVGAHVTLAARSKERLQATAAELAGVNPHGTQLATIAVDVSDTEALNAAIQALGSTDHVLVTAAQSAHGLVKDTPVKSVRVVMERVDVAYEVARTLAERLPPRGSLTLTSGTLGERPARGLAMTAASVGALEAMMRSLALELAPIRVNVLRPGYIDTRDGRDGIGGGETMEELASCIPAGRVGRPEEAAAGALACMSNPYMTGSIVQVDGGLSLV